MALENINAHGNLVTFTDRTPDDFTASIALNTDDMEQLLTALPDEMYDAIIAKVEQRKASARVRKMPELRKADREERASRRKEMQQDMRNSYAR